MKKQIMKKAAAAALACGLIFSTGIVAFAEYDEKSGYAGSTYLVAEAGYNGRRAYAKVSASDYVDARMDGRATFTYSDGTFDSRKISGGFDQGTSGEVSVSCEGNVYSVDCWIDVYSSDGSWGRQLSAI